MKRSYRLTWLAVGVAVLTGLAVAKSLPRPGPSDETAPTAPNTVARAIPAHATQTIAATPAPAAATPSPPTAVASPKRSRPTAPSKAPAATERAPVAGQSGMIAAIDPETGRLGPPSPEQARALAARTDAFVSKNSDGLRQTVLPNGAVVLHHDGRFQDYVVVRIGRDGKPALGCAHDDDGKLIDAPATEIRMPAGEEE